MKDFILWLSQDRDRQLLFATAIGVGLFYGYVLVTGVIDHFRRRG